MTNTPEFFADRPEAGTAPSVPDGAQARDLLSALLRTVRLRGEQIFCCQPRSPFAISFDHPGGTIHIIQEGQFELELEAQRTAHRYERGDVILLPAGHPHTVRNGRRLRPRPLAPTDLGDSAASANTGTRWLCGTFAFEDSHAAQLLYGLPPVIELRGAGDQSLVWLDVSARMLMHETTSPSQGAQAMISRILDLLFIQVLRAWARRRDAAPGWLTGAMDRVVGEAITAIHANPRHPWTVERLAKKSNLSRSAFAERFTSRVGQPPLTYITEVRLSSAADLLLETTEPIGVIATNIGYESEPAFSRAFSRRYGIAPSRWRHEAQQQR